MDIFTIGAIIGGIVLLSKKKEAPKLLPVQAAPVPPPAGCIILGEDRRGFMGLTPELQNLVKLHMDQGFSIKKVPTGEVLMAGTKSQVDVVRIWACPPGATPPIDSQSVATRTSLAVMPLPSVNYTESEIQRIMAETFGANRGISVQPIYPKQCKPGSLEC